MACLFYVCVSMKVRGALELLLKNVGHEALLPLIPSSHAKQLEHLRKTQVRNEKQKVPCCNLCDSAPVIPKQGREMGGSIGMICCRVHACSPNSAFSYGPSPPVCCRACIYRCARTNH